MALPFAQPKFAADLEAHYERLRTCPEMVDTRDHLPLFRSLSGRILEIGCDCGNSTTAFLLSAASLVTSIDLNPVCESNFPDSTRWQFVLGDSRDPKVFYKVCNQRYDVLYIDGDHSYEGAWEDLRDYSELVLNGGLILMHDVLATDNFPGVFKAFRRFHSSRARAKYILPGSYGLGVIEL